MKKVLVTLGGTRERIDDVRFITNLSTGRTGSVIASRLASDGCSVDCLCGEGSVRPEGKNLRTASFSDFRDLDGKLKKFLRAGSYDAVVHLAAVSDYSVKAVRAGRRAVSAGRRGKIPSEARELTIVLGRNFKILDRLKAYAGAAGGRRPPLIVGFKLTSCASGRKLAASVGALKAADLVVHNDLSEMGKGHPFHVYRDGKKIRDCRNAAALAGVLSAVIRAGDKGRDHVIGA